MALHYLKNTETGDVRNVLTATLDRYLERDGWKVFDTVEARDACPMAGVKFGISGEGTTIQEIDPGSFDSYRRAGWVLVDTREEAERLVQEVFYISDFAVQSCSRYGAQINGRTAYDTREEAERNVEPSIWVFDRFGHNYSRPTRIALNRVGEFPARDYVFGATREEAIAALPVRYIWGTESGKYVRTTTQQGYSLFRQTRRLLEAMRNGRDRYYHYYYSPYDFNEGGRNEMGAASGLRKLWDRWKQSHGSMEREARAASFVRRVNAYSGSEDVRVCQHCEAEPYHVSDEATLGDQYVCSMCIELYAACHECSGVFGREEMIGDEEGDLFCREHRPNLRDPRGGELMAYSTDVTSRKQSFLLATGERKADLWLGWELEVYPASGLRQRGVVEEVRRVFGDFCICKSDSSLHGDGGFEIVSIPATLSWHRENSVPFLRAMSGKIEGWKHDGAGLHVHIGRKELGALQIGRMSSFLDHPDNGGFVTRIAGRSATDYCTRLLKSLNTARDPADGRYHALNLSTRKKATVEVRIFRSNVSPLGFLKSLEFTHCLATWARDCGNLVAAPTQQGIKGTGGDSVAAFVAHVVRRRAEYPKLHAWLQEQRIVEGGRYEPVSIGA